jgi:hypothetical protein
VTWCFILDAADASDGHCRRLGHFTVCSRASEEQDLVTIPYVDHPRSPRRR